MPDESTTKTKRPRRFHVVSLSLDRADMNAFEDWAMRDCGRAEYLPRHDSGSLVMRDIIKAYNAREIVWTPNGLRYTARKGGNGTRTRKHKA